MKRFSTFLLTAILCMPCLAQSSEASYIKTPDGIGVGYSTRELFKKKRMEWVNYYDGTCFGTSGNYLYYVNPEELVGTDIPNKAEDFKPDAKVIGIAYVSN